MATPFRPSQGHRQSQGQPAMRLSSYSGMRKGV
nr:MAG TPA: hypothetical protein [Caudoviricetes sp.]